jgi:hypothetical protein
MFLLLDTYVDCDMLVTVKVAAIFHFVFPDVLVQNGQREQKIMILGEPLMYMHT